MKNTVLLEIIILVLLITFCATPEEKMQQIQVTGYGRGTFHQGDEVVSREEAISRLKDLVKSNKKININGKDADGNTLLLFFIVQKDIEMIKMLLERGADINAKDRNGTSPLSASIGNLEILKLLIKHGLDTNVQNDGGWTALHYAASRGYLEVIKYLVEQHGANVNAKDQDGSTPLIMQHDFEVMKYLVEKGADINAKNKYEHTALGNEAFFGSSEGMKYLIDKGADVSAKHEDIGEDGITTPTMLDMIIRRSYNFNKMKLLIEHGANVNVKSNNGKTALIYATEKNNLEAVKYLVEHGATVNTKYDNGKTSLICAADNGYLEIVKYLVGKKADVNAKDKDGKTALDFAVKKNYLEIVVFLMPLTNQKK